MNCLPVVSSKQHWRAGHRRLLRGRCHIVVTSGCESGELTGDGLRPFVLVGRPRKPLQHKEIRPISDWGQMVAGSNPVSPTRKSSLCLVFSVAETAITVQLLFVWDHVVGCEAFFGRTCPMVK
jgi:hypothetical protein